MRKLSRLFPVVAVVLAACADESSAPTRVPDDARFSTENGAQDFAVGGGQYANSSPACASPSYPAGDFTGTIALSAHVAADGLSPNTATGEITEIIHQPGGPCHGSRYTARVTCLAVNGNLATIEGSVRHATGFFADHVTEHLTVMDDPVGPDTFNRSNTFETCPVGVLPPTLPLAQGEFVVEDNP